MMPPDRSLRKIISGIFMKTTGFSCRACYNKSNYGKEASVNMDCTTALFDLKMPSPEAKPLMLHELLFCPLLTWACLELSVRGIQRFFIVCGEKWRTDVQNALQDVSDAQLFDSVEEALCAAAGDIVVLPSPVLPVDVFSVSPVYAADVHVLRAHMAAGRALTVRPEGAEAPVSFLPFRSAEELQRAMPICREHIAAHFARQGVTIIDPANTYIDPRCRIGEGVTLLPGTILRGRTVIGRGCEIGPNAMIRDCTVGEYTTVNASQLNESTVGSHTTVGPFAYVRPKCVIGEHCRVGDFVELKNSVIGNGTKVSHLTYVGDSDVGEKVNFGCGTVTTNYDGHRKSRCTIGDNVFLGCNTNLIAPVTLGDGAYTAAGSTVTEDVEADALAIARAKQVNKPGWAARFRASWNKNSK